MTNPNALTIIKYGKPGVPSIYLRNGEYPGNDLESPPEINSEAGVIDLYQLKAIDAETGMILKDHPVQGSNRFTFGILINNNNNNNSYISYHTINTIPAPNPNKINYFNS